MSRIHNLTRDVYKRQVDGRAAPNWSSGQYRIGLWESALRPKLSQTLAAYVQHVGEFTAPINLELGDERVRVDHASRDHGAGRKVQRSYAVRNQTFTTCLGMTQ